MSENKTMDRASDKAYRRIREGIVSGEIAPGSQLKEEELALLCGVSRTPVRDALRRLEADMLVLRTDTQRSFVPTWSREEVEEIFHIRAMLEGFAAERAASRITADQLAELEACNTLIHDALFGDPPDYTGFVEHNQRFHNLIMEVAGTQRLSRIVNLLVEQPLLQRPALNLGVPGILRSHAGHTDLLQAFEARDPEWARDAMQSHVRHAMYVTLYGHEQVVEKGG